METHRTNIAQVIPLKSSPTMIVGMALRAAAIYTIAITSNCRFILSIWPLFSVWKPDERLTKGTYGLLPIRLPRPEGTHAPGTNARA